MLAGLGVEGTEIEPAGLAAFAAGAAADNADYEYVFDCEQDGVGIEAVFVIGGGV
jgi:hypothetical protein